jgi:hypothetical protein
MLRPRDDDDQKVLESKSRPSRVTFPGHRMSSAIMSRPPVSHIGPRSFASKALFVSATLRSASAKPLSRVLPGPIRLLRGGRKSRSRALRRAAVPVPAAQSLGREVPPSGRVGRHPRPSGRHDADHQPGLHARGAARKRNPGQSGPRARRGRARAARGDSPAKDVDRNRVGPSRHESRGQGRRAAGCRHWQGTMILAGDDYGGPASGRRVTEARSPLATLS